MRNTLVKSCVRRHTTHHSLRTKMLTSIIQHSYKQEVRAHRDSSVTRVEMTAGIVPAILFHRKSLKWQQIHLEKLRGGAKANTH